MGRRADRKPPILSINSSASSVSCSGGSDGSVATSVSGGLPPYTYLWSDGSNSAQRSGLGAGTYAVTVSDAQGQQASTSAVVTEPVAITPLLVSTDETLSGNSDGTASTTVSGGTPPYSYNWSNGSNQPSLLGLAPGTYGLTVTDANGCSHSQAFSIGAGPAPLSLQMSSTDIACSGTPGSASVTPSGGTPPYSYDWSTGDTQTSISITLVGMYVVTVTDSQGQIASDSIFVVGEQFPAQVILDLTDTCLSTISLIISGGNGPYQFDWTDFNDPIVRGANGLYRP